MDAQNAPTGPWKLQNSFHSANSAHLLFEKDPTQTEESPSVNPVLGFHNGFNELQAHVFLDLGTGTRIVT
jgi:hypothetical protein